MSYGISTSSGADKGTLTVVFMNESPVALDDIGSFLSAMARDYRQMSGRNLTIKSVRQGSLIIEVVEYATIVFGAMGAIVTLRDFLVMIGGVIARAKNDPGILQSRRSQGVKTVAELVRVSRNSHSNIHIIHESGGDRTEVRLSQADAEQIHRQDEQLRADRVFSSKQKLLLKSEQVDDAIEGIARVASEIDADHKNIGGQNRDNFDLFEVLVRAVLDLPDGRRRLEKLMVELDRQGHNAAANTLRRILDIN